MRKEAFVHTTWKGGRKKRRGDEKLETRRTSADLVLGSRARVLTRDFPVSGRKAVLRKGQRVTAQHPPPRKAEFVDPEMLRTMEAGGYFDKPRGKAKGEEG